jgi:hypothetical protein
MSPHDPLLLVLQARRQSATRPASRARRSSGPRLKQAPVQRAQGIESVDAQGRRAVINLSAGWPPPD